MTVDAAAWVTSSCRALGLAVTSPGEPVHDRPWSSAVVHEVRDLAGATGRVWFKANGPGTRNEPALLSLLASLVPDLVPEVLAVDVDRAWSLTRDAGPTWRSSLPVADHWPWWEDLLQRYAATQLTLAASRPELLATGTPERSPATLPDQAAELIAELSMLSVDTGGLSGDESAALMAVLPSYGQRCRELAGAGIPSTIQHDDLHSNNICRNNPADGGSDRPQPAVGGAGRDGRDGQRGPGASAGSRIIDWGDASVGHPFGTMVSTLRSIAFHAGCDVDDPRLMRVRDAYLEPFTTFASPAELAALVAVAEWVGAVTRALSWRSALLGAPNAVQREHEFPVRGWLLELLASPSPR